MPEFTVESIDIPIYKIGYLRKKIEKLNKKAKKMGCEPMILTFDNLHTITYKRHPLTDYELAYPMVVEMITAHLNYIIPNIDGYELIAKLDIFPGQDGNTEVIVSGVPEKEIPEKYKNTKTIQCDHCGHNRYRTHSILIRHIETGEYKEVGSTCVKDFFHGNDPSKFMYMASIQFGEIIKGLKDDDELTSDYGKRNIWAYDILPVLTISAAAIAKWGYFSKAKAEQKAFELGWMDYPTTKDHVFDNLHPRPRMDEEDRVRIEQEDIDLAQATFEYFETLDPGTNDYLLNCCKIISLGYVPGKFVGIACSMIVAYKKANALIEENKKRANEPQSEHVGSIKERLKNIKVTVIYKREFFNDFGENILYVFKDENGNIFKTFYSGHSWKCDVDNIVEITGTVKKHDNYNGKKETILKRVSVK